MSTQKSLYAVFGVPDFTPIVEIHRLWQASGFANGPMAPGDPLFMEAQRAYVVLTDPPKRAAYDERLRRERGL